MPFSELRNVDLSIRYRLFALLRQHGWFHAEFDTSLEPVEEGSLTYRKPDNQFPFVFLDDEYAAWPSGTKVYDAGNPVPSGSYVVNYMDGQITLSAPPSGRVTADLTLYDVNVREGYPADEELELAAIPMIAYDIEKDDSEPFDIGTQFKWRRRYVTLDILTVNDGQRKDLTDNVGRYIGVLPYLDFSDHQPLDEQHRLDTAFSFADQWNGNIYQPEGVRGDLVKPRQGGSEKERYRSLVAFETEGVS